MTNPTTDLRPGSLVRLVGTVKTEDGHVYRRGRVFRVLRWWSDDVRHPQYRHIELESPGAEFLGRRAARIAGVSPADVELVDRRSSGWCRVCGRTGQESDRFYPARSPEFWVDGRRRLCSPCADLMCHQCIRRGLACDGMDACEYLGTRAATGKPFPLAGEGGVRATS